MVMDDFMKRWKGLEGSGRDQQVRRQRLCARQHARTHARTHAQAAYRENTPPARMPPQEVFAGASPIDISAARALLAGPMRLSLVESPEPQAVNAAGTYRTGTLGPNGEKISVGLLVRVEANAAAGMFRVSVRAVHPTVSTAIKTIVKNQV